MVFDYALAGVVTAGLMVYLVYALLRPERLWCPLIRKSSRWLRIKSYANNKAPCH